MKVNQLTDKIFTIDEVLTAEECQHYIAHTEAVGYEPAPVTTAKGPKMIPDFRNNERVMYDDSALAQMLWQRVQALIPAQLHNSTAAGLNERFRFYRYYPGQEFKAHIDGRFVRNPQEASMLTFLIYLNDDFTGGETSFQEVCVAPKKGSALVFWHHVLHAGLPVLTGVKYVLRSDVMYNKG